MDRGRALWLLLPEPVRRMPADLAAVVLLTVITVLVVFLPVISDTPARVVFGLAFVLFLPGYAFIAALFPEEGSPPALEEEEASRIRDRGIDGIERVALAFGLSIAIVPLIGLVLNFTPWGIRLVPIVASLSVFTIGCSIVATVRRWELDPEDRFHVPYRAWIAAAHDELFNPEDRTDATLNVILALSILLAISTLGYAIAVPPDGERFTEFYYLSEDEEGELVAANFPTEFVEGEGQSLYLGIGNNEHETVAYTVVIQVQDESFVDNESTVHERSEIDRFQIEVEHDDTWLEEVTITPEMVGDQLRLQFLLYIGDAPATADRESAYRDLHLWIDVEAADD